MIQKIIDGIVGRLCAAFPGCKVYTEQVPQNLSKPSFSIQLINPAKEQFLKNRYYITNLFAVQYFPESKNNPKAECYAVLERLYWALEYIDVDGDLQRGTGMRAEYFDGVLSFVVSYDMFVDVAVDCELMEDITIDNQIKKG